MVGWLSKKWDPLSGLPDLTGRVVVVTGGKYVFGLGRISILVV